MGLQGPLRRAEGKGVKRSDHQERSSQFSLSALNNLQGVEYQPCGFFCFLKIKCYICGALHLVRALHIESVFAILQENVEVFKNEG